MIPRTDQAIVLSQFVANSRCHTALSTPDASLACKGVCTEKVEAQIRARRAKPTHRSVVPVNPPCGNQTKRSAQPASMSIAGPTTQVVRRWWACAYAGNASAVTEPING